MKRLLTALLASAMTCSLMSPATLAYAGEVATGAVEVSPEEDGQPTQSAPAGGNGASDEELVDVEPEVDEVVPVADSGETGLFAQADGLAAQDDPVGTASISVDFGFVEPDNYRNTFQYPSGGSVAWMRLPYFSSGALDLLNESGEVVRSFTGSSRPRMTNLPAGTYTLRVTALDRGPYKIVRGVVNGGPIDFLLTEYETEIVLEEGQSKLFWVALEYAAYGLKTTTDVGTFENGTTEHVYYEGWNGHFQNKDASSSANNPILNTHNGIYHGDSASQYNMNKLEVPALSDEEVAKGYRFEGWQIEGDESGKVYATDEALTHRITADTVFKAVWSHPSHTVSFHTSSDCGTIAGGTTYSYTKDFNNGLVDHIPAVEPKNGYEFVGWFTDLTVNVVPDDAIRATKVDRDLHYYAKYQRQTARYTVQYLPGTDGTLEGKDTLLLDAGSQVTSIPTVHANQGANFHNKWRVTAVTEGNGELAVGDVLSETQIALLRINYDLNLEPVYTKKTYTVIYQDGANNTVFMPVTHEDLEHGVETPDHGLILVRDGHVFLGWDQEIHDTVTRDMTYTARWLSAESDGGSGGATPAPADPTTPTNPGTTTPTTTPGTTDPATTTPATTTPEKTDTEKTDTEKTGNSKASATKASASSTTSTPATTTRTVTTGTSTPAGTTVVSTAATPAQTSLAKTGDAAAQPLPALLAGTALVAGAVATRRRKA